MQCVVDARNIPAGDESPDVFRFLKAIMRRRFRKTPGIIIIWITIHQIDSNLIRICFAGEHQHRIPDFHQKCAKLFVDIIDKDILPKVKRSPLRNSSISQLHNTSCFCFVALLLGK